MIFNYNTLSVELQKETKSIFVTLNRPEVQNAINIEMLFELEGLFGWLTSHLEVNTVVLRGSDNYFSSGFDQRELELMGQEKLIKYLNRFHKLITGMQFLPQTIICDMGEGAQGMAIEFCLGADIRVSSDHSSLKFNCLQNGWVPCSGGVSILSNLIGTSLARQWTLSSSEVGSHQLLSSGLVMELYRENGEALVNKLLQNISKQAPIARIQTKRSFLEKELEAQQEVQHNDTRFAYAGLHLREWSKKDYKEFISAREMAYALQKENNTEERTGPKLV